MKKGCTLLELMIVIFIIAIIAAMSIPALIKAKEEGLKKKYPELKDSEAVRIYVEGDYVVEQFDDHKLLMHIKTRFRFMEKNGKRMPLSSDPDELKSLKDLEKLDDTRVQQIIEEKRKFQEIENRKREDFESEQLHIEQEEWDNTKKAF